METEQILAQILLRHSREAGGLLPALHDIQEALGCVPAGASAAIAEAFNVSSAEVHGVVSFYSDFLTEPAGRHTVSICQAESCQAAGGRELTDHIEQRLGVALGETTADGAITLKPVYCLGNCACSPSISIDGQSFARVDADRFDSLSESLGEGGKSS